ncbi:MAG: protoporphyrinogen oxidase [Gemmataceae bacterium]
MSPRVVVVGAGLAGLSVAFRLRQLRPDVQLTLLESRGRPGGNVGTLAADGFRLETGPNGFLDSKPGALALCRDLGLGDRLVAASEGSRKNRFVYADGRVQKLPASPVGLLTTRLLSLGGKLSLLREPFRRRPADAPADESVAAFARRRFGPEAAAAFIDPLVTGILAADPERVSVRAAFPRLVEFERDRGSVLRGFLAAAKQKRREAEARGETRQPTRMWSFREGLQAMVDALRERAGDALVCGVRVTRVEKTADGWAVHADGRDRWAADAVVLAAPAYEQAAAVADLDPALAADLAGIAYNRIAVAGLGYRVADVPAVPDGFGYIAPGRLKRDVLGVQWCSSIFPDRAPPGFVLWRALCGGAGRPDLFDLSDDELVRRCHAELAHTLGVTGPPAFVRVVRWPNAIPQYHLGHPDRVARIEAAVARHPGLFVTGNALHGVALSDVTEDASRVATRLAR